MPLTPIAAESSLPAWLQARRSDARAAFADASLPDVADEMWRYTRIADLPLDKFHPTASSTPDMSALAEQVLSALGVSAPVHTVNGHFMTPSQPTEFARLAGDDDHHAIAARRSEDAALATISDALAEPVIIDVPARATLTTPVVVVHDSTSSNSLSAPRLHVQVGEGAQVSVVEIVTTDDQPHCLVPTTTFSLADRSVVTYLRVQVLGEQTWHFAETSASLASSAQLHYGVLALGGRYARLVGDTHLRGTGASAQLNAVYLADDDHMIDFRSLQDHEGRKTSSDLVFKGAVAGTSRGVYSGLIRVRKGAKGADAHQTNRTLVLSDGASADAVPNLEIDENDLQCSHASATGPIDEDQRFYLEARGVPGDVAERLIVLGFFEDLLGGLPVPGTHAILRSLVATSLEKVMSK